jgi:hypothetical protein
MLRNGRAWLFISLLVSCKADSRPARNDAIAPPAVTSRPVGAENSVASLAGDTLELVSVGGRQLPDVRQPHLPCDSAGTPLLQRIVLARDSTYSGIIVHRPGCRDTLASSSDTLEYGGIYKVHGDTLTLYTDDVDEIAQTYNGVLFPDSVVPVLAEKEKAWLYSRRPGSGAAGETGIVRTDSVFLARDIDGSGKTDYVVREIKLSPIAHVRAYRIAVYLDKDPGTAKPDWAMEFDDEFGGMYQTLGKSLSMAPGVSLLDIQSSGADYDADEILVVQRGSIRQDISHGVDYGHGYLDIRQERGKVVVEATLEHLELRGTPVTSEISCKEPKWGAMQLVFNAQKGQFMPDRVVCGSPK